MNRIAKALEIDIIGESHSERLGVRMRSFPIGEIFSLSELEKFLDRRRPGGICEIDDASQMLKEIASACSTKRKESDRIFFESGIAIDGDTCQIVGDEIEAYILNEDVRKEDYEKIRTVLRPGHADLGAYLKYGIDGLKTGGGQFSGRMTAVICIAGGIAKQILHNQGVEINAYIDEIGPCKYEEDSVDSKEAILEEIASAKETGDSLGGIVKLCASGYPGGIGGALFDGLEGDLARAMYAIPSVKGTEFGSGFYGSRIRGSRNNDEYHLESGKIVSWTNRQGGISGGISTGMDICMRIAFKPVPSIGIPQASVDVAEGTEKEIKISGRHDVCVVPRVLPVVEAMTALVLYDRMIGE